MESRFSVFGHSMSVYAALAYALIFCACVVRVWSFPIITTDYTYFVAKWFATLQENPGLTAFLHPFADYAPAKTAPINPTRP
jgi:hypothetical protein